MGSPWRHLRPDQREQEELVRPDDETNQAISYYYSSPIFLYIYGSIGLRLLAHVIPTTWGCNVQDPGMGGWVLQLRGVWL